LPRLTAWRSTTAPKAAAWADRFYSEIQNNGVIFMPVWAYTWAAHLVEAQDYQLCLVDTRFESVEHCAQADLFFYSGLNQDSGSLMAARDKLARRFPNARHVLGGPLLRHGLCTGR
jgi:hypothetical protein